MALNDWSHLNGLLKSWGAPELFRADMNYSEFCKAFDFLLMRTRVSIETWTKLCDEIKEN